ncbi:MAG: alkyl sulfatase dimerization domain-containing protein [Acidimicrobiales bacterium]
MALHPKPRDLDQIHTNDPIELSSRVIDSGFADEPTNRVTNRATELRDDIALVESFSHIVVVRTRGGLVCFDSSGHLTGAACTESLRGWSTARIDKLVYTHGHFDHVGGSPFLFADAERRGYEPPQVIGHENVPKRFQRYDDMSGWNVIINRRQFGGVSPRHGLQAPTNERFIQDSVWPDVTYRDHHTLEVDDLVIELHHAKGETDDHTWAWIPAHKTLCVGDLVVWVFPNAGNPQKVQRYPLEWASVLRTLMSYDAELLIPAHGLPIAGRSRITRVLGDMATALEALVAETIDRMNVGQTLDTIIHEVHVDPDLMELPWMAPMYDEPEFVVRNVWRMYGGWWDADPAHLKPSPKADLAKELATLVGGVDNLTSRAREVADSGNFRLGCHLIELAVQAEPDNRSAHALRADIYTERRRAESSLMAKGIFSAAAQESTEYVDRTGGIGSGG